MNPGRSHLRCDGPLNPGLRPAARLHNAAMRFFPPPLIRQEPNAVGKPHQMLGVQFHDEDHGSAFLLTMRRVSAQRAKYLSIGVKPANHLGQKGQFSPLGETIHGDRTSDLVVAVLYGGVPFGVVEDNFSASISAEERNRSRPGLWSTVFRVLPRY